MNFLEEIRTKREQLQQALEANKDAVNLDIFRDFYPDKAHFIYELLQNAEDAKASEVVFSLSKTSLLFEHNGRPFNKDDINSITGFNVSTKEDSDDKIGQFGIGFKAVYAYTEQPHIWSPTFSFKISDMWFPWELEPDLSLDRQTRFQLPFNSEFKPLADAFSEVKVWLEEISDDTLLFLSNIRSIHWRIDGGQGGKILRISRTENYIEIQREIDGKSAESSHFLRFTQPVKRLKKQYAAIAFKLEALSDDNSSSPDTSLKTRFRIVPTRQARVAVYFTAERETSGLRFHLHAPFVPELSRASVKDTPANIPLYQQLASLTAESLGEIRKLGMLDRDFLAVLPTPHDDLPDRYECIRTAIVDAMNEQKLTPTYTKSHAPAKNLLQAPDSLKKFLSVKDIKAIDDFESLPIAWAVAATQKNSDIDRFLSGLAITNWGIDRLVDLLEQRLSATFWRSPDERLLEWLRSKPKGWHQRLYSLLYRELEPKNELDRFKNACIVRISSGEYKKGSDCYFPTGEDQDDAIHPRVAEGTYTSGGSKKEQERAKKFLKDVGVGEVGEREQVKAILEKRYLKEAPVPNRTVHRKDMQRFIDLVKDNPDEVSLFEQYRIFEAENGNLSKPRNIYLDLPYEDTGLHEYNTAVRDKFEYLASSRPVVASSLRVEMPALLKAEIELFKKYRRFPLAQRYKKLGISLEELTRFACLVGASCQLDIHKVSCKGNPEWGDNLSKAIGRKATPIDRDYTIIGLSEVLQYPTVTLSRIIWGMLSTQLQDEKYLWATYQNNNSHGPRTARSRLVHYLRNRAWIPHDGKFVPPSKATRESLPDGFPFDSGWRWLDAIGFGKESKKNVEQRVQEKEILGIDDDGAVDDAKWFGRLPARIREQFRVTHESTIEPPDHKPHDPERRAIKVREGARNAPERITEKRERSQSINLDPIKEQARTYLREQYTNHDGIMLCQVGWHELPFKLGDGSYYFEAIEFLPELKKLYYQNYLALCPNHAAMYQHTVDTKKFFCPLVPEFKIVLAGNKSTIHFTKTHRDDIEAVTEEE